LYSPLFSSISGFANYRGTLPPLIFFPLSFLSFLAGPWCMATGTTSLSGHPPGRTPPLHPWALFTHPFSPFWPKSTPSPAHPKTSPAQATERRSLSGSCVR
jgi:hypothetical protein